MTSEDRFEQLLDGVRRGDERAAAELFRRVQPRLVRYVRSQEARVAEDLAADVWLAVSAGLDSFEGGEAGFRAWVFTIARRRIVDHRRKGIRRRTNPVGPEEFEDRVDTGSGTDPTERNDSQEAVDLITATLPPDQAEVILLRVLADLDAETVAGIMGRTAGWVRVTQHRALKRLATALRRTTDVTP